MNLTFQNLQKWMNGAEHGVIFFSMGSNAKSSLFPKEMIEIFMNTLGKLKERVIFKWEADELPGKPDNVLVAKWLPQNEILNHKNIKLFISHCGLGSTIEALHYAVPVIGMPIYGDQISNAYFVQAEGWGIVVAMDRMSEESFSKGVHEMLSNPK
jgi:glucuronosyltransferase